MEYGLIGEKLPHSFSKEIHEKLGYYQYSLKELKREELEDFILQKNFKGINVTIPYKQDVIPLLDEVDPDALAIGSPSAALMSTPATFRPLIILE